MLLNYWPHHATHKLAADAVEMETYYYGHQSVDAAVDSRVPLTFDLDI